jgi:hypothetical protein
MALRSDSHGANVDGESRPNQSLEEAWTIRLKGWTTPYC